MELRDYTRCIVCQSKDAAILVSKDQLSAERAELVPIFERFFYPDAPHFMLKDHAFFTHTYDAQLVVCKRCGLVCRDPRLSPQGSVRAYSEDEYHPEWLRASFEPYRQSFLPEMPKLNKMIKPGARVLEVGSQIGGFLSVAQENGWEAEGVDVGQCVSDFARSRGFNVKTGTLVDAQFPDNSFDAVFIWLCFEMLPDPWADLAEVRRILSDKGWLIISVPNGDFIKLIQPLVNDKAWISVRNRMRKFLAYAIMLGFPFQLGYTPSALRHILGESGFVDVNIRNQYYVPVSPPEYVHPRKIREKDRYLRFVHYTAEIAYYASLHSVIKGPWLTVTCRKGA
jgi:SAM-dependent methyltransferase